MDNLLVAALSLAISQVVLSATLLLREHKQWRLPQSVLGLFLVATCAYLLRPFFTQHWLEDWLIPIETAVPGFFWLLCYSLFDDRFKLRFWNLGLVAVTVMLPQLGILSVYLGGPSWHWLFDIFPQAIEFVLLAWALYVVVRFWRDDLIEARRDLRLIFSAIAGLYIFIMVVLRELVITDEQWLEQSQYFPVGIICLIMNLLFLQYKPTIFGRVDPVNPPTPISLDDCGISSLDIPPEVLSQLEHMMLEQRVYREMGLTIGQLAKRLELPEYRLRKIINTGLGYRNFNDYLNGFRIKEAGERLADSRMADQAVLNIALDVGFRSLSSFNKAFRAVYGVTPTVFRQTHLP
ncbi:helix-turn-helix domain-containing protein [Arenicella xantha]|nr:helix-turn-helix domain-containing protein [Arenicella xantha]